jgi:hypothetical protein
MTYSLNFTRTSNLTGRQRPVISVCVRCVEISLKRQGTGAGHTPRLSLVWLAGFFHIRWAIFIQTGPLFLFRGAPLLFVLWGPASRSCVLNQGQCDSLGFIYTKRFRGHIPSARQLRLRASSYPPPIRKAPRIPRSLLAPYPKSHWPKAKSHRNRNKFKSNSPNQPQQKGLVQ